jgi:hypothetical protein
MAIGGALEALTEQLQEQLQNYNGEGGQRRQQTRRASTRQQQQQQQQQYLQQQQQQYQQQQYQQQQQQYYGGQQHQLYGGQQIAGNVKVYTGPKQGKFIINKHGKKVYIDRKSLNNNVPYLKKNAKKAKAVKK